LGKASAAAVASWALVGGSVAYAEAKLSAGLWVANDFMDYGQSRTGHKPALQAEVNYKLDHDLYAGVFTSSVHDGVDYGQEFQAMFGVQKEFAGIEFDAFVNNHLFVGRGDFHEDNFWEVELDASRSFGPVTAVAALVGEPADGLGLEGFGFFGLQSEVELPRGLSLQSSVGRLIFSEAGGDEDHFVYASGLAWAHPLGFEVFGGFEGVSLDGKLHPVIRIGRAF
jgi:uncharacterized protein (TIGR02001 family)